MEKDSTDLNLPNPILDRIVGYGFQGGPVLAQFAKKDQELISSYLDRSDVRKLLPAQYRYIKFAWGKAEANGEVIELYALQSNRNGEPPLSGGVVVDAMQTYDAVGKPASI